MSLSQAVPGTAFSECNRDSGAPACASVPRVRPANLHRRRPGHSARLSPSNSKARKQAVNLCVLVSHLTTWGQKRHSNCPSLAFELPLSDCNCRPQQMFSISEPEQLPLTMVDTLSILHSYFCFLGSNNTQPSHEVCNQCVYKNTSDAAK